jgi:twitching motility two-component system response regulator PilH
MANHLPRLLIVDDSAEFLSFMEALLASEGFTVEIASTAEAVQDRVASAVPDLVICDVRMPDMAPFAVLDLLREHDSTRNVPVLLCTGAVQEVDQAERWLAERGVEVLFKPFDVDDLLSRIQKLSKHRTG